MSTLDLLLTNQYQDLVHFNTIQSNSKNSTMIGSCTINTNLVINGNSLLNKSLSINSSLNVNGNTYINGNISINSLMNILGNANINFVTFNSNFSVLGNTNLYNLTSNSIFISGNTTISGNSTINSLILLGNLKTNNLSLTSFNISGYTKINGSLTINSPLIITSYSILNNLSVNSLLYISNNSIICGNTTILSNLYVSNNSILSGNNTINNNFNISGLSLILGLLSITSNLNISNNIKLNNIQILSSLYVSSSSILNGISFNSSLIVSGDSILNSLTCNSSLYISGKTLIEGNVSINSNINISGNAILNNVVVNNNVTFNSSLNISGSSNINNLNILGNLTSKLQEYYYNEDAYINGIPIWGLYRTGGIVKIRLDIQPIFISLLGINPYILYVGDTYSDPGIITTMMVNTISNETIITYITSIISSDQGEVLSSGSNILVSKLPTIISNTIMNTSIDRTFNITYTSTSSSGLISTQSRMINVYLIPTINSITLLSQTQINVSISGQYYYSTYKITLNGTLVIGETVFTTNIIDISMLSSNTQSYTITIYLKRSSGTILCSNTLIFKIYNLTQIIKTPSPMIIYKSSNTIFNLYTSIQAIDPYTNNSIILTSSNIILIQDSYGNYLDIPSTGLLNTSNSITYTIIYTITDTNGNNNIVPFILKIFNQTKINFSSAYINLSIDTYTNNPNSIYFNSSGLYQSFCSKWSLIPSYLSSIGLNYNSNWSIVFRGTYLNQGPGSFSLVCFNVSYDKSPVPNNSFNYDGVVAYKNIRFNGDNYLFDLNFCSLLNNNTYYFVISNNNSFLNVSLYTTGGVQILNSSTLNKFTFTRESLFDIYMEDTWQFTSGVLINPSASTLTYQDFISEFGI